MVKNIRHPFEKVAKTGGIGYTYMEMEHLIISGYKTFITAGQRRLYLIMLSNRLG